MPYYAKVTDGVAALLKANTDVAVPTGDPEDEFGGIIKYPFKVITAWPDADRKAAGVYEIVRATKPEGFSVVSRSLQYDAVTDQVDEVLQLEANPPPLTEKDYWAELKDEPLARAMILGFSELTGKTPAQVYSWLREKLNG